ncbi:uncharacterized protein LOC134811448 isoform X2 [Bolinopsis microptera]|uniref:uncharacterized protein LOC134811448 isoform X2 n=1 Tax=Bolinopsis microptera TaxID=2820187 RepID=UPI00307AAE09
MSSEKSSSQSSQGKNEACLLDLPSQNKTNFALYDRAKPLNKRPIQYISVNKESDPQPQVIVSDKRNLLVKYYSKRWHYVKGTPGGSSGKKRDVNEVDNNEDNPGPSNKHLRTG